MGGFAALTNYCLRVPAHRVHTLRVEDAELEALLAGVEESDLTTMDSLTLVAELKRLDHELGDLGQIIHPNPSSAARELHSRRGAIVVILRNRNHL